MFELLNSNTLQNTISRNEFFSAETKICKLMVHAYGVSHQLRHLLYSYSFDRDPLSSTCINVTSDLEKKRKESVRVKTIQLTLYLSST